MVKKDIKLEDFRFDDLDQYDFNFEEDVVIAKEKKYAAKLGSFFIWFSQFEHSLDIELSSVINSYGHWQGMLIIKDLDLSEKIDTFYNLCFQFIHLADSGNKTKLLSLDNLRLRMEKLSVLRNKLAHAKWDTLDDDLYVRVDTKLGKIDGNIKFRKVRITPGVIVLGTKESRSLSERIHLFYEEMFMGVFVAKEKN